MVRHILSAIGLASLLCVGTQLMSCASTRTQESTGEYVDDSTVTAKVKAAFVEDAKLKSFQISVKTYKGTVQLSGFVDSRDMVDRAGDLARRVGGVQSVKNDLNVK